ncbi:TrbI/VirB10 family protein [Legionella anisa]|uniref:Conjugal transfer protein TraB n=1 Tax=Legionella anisa TaxID=28082 RepID=A0AAX0WYX2_9GAMM|nr:MULTISPECIES: TrbI/VirB10 family protein [Legionella]HAT9164302.1 conjugal transfer protein TraB [Legionella pneumophila subsp. pneumophila]AOU90884.1 conjugal transfer protein TraB [Legionella pneumophila]AWN76016.1 conjugal transfer protein TraB [Legionella anisa]MCW8426897.1 conjugal transfer protein TraB [Legionella anisa]MCW8449562.1 conjugal transfer protein TraB [Legionella anisa]
MASWQWNKMVKGRQVRTLIVAGSCLFFLVAMMIVLLADGRPKKTQVLKKSVDLTGIVEESFTDAVADNALTTQQTELESLKKQIGELTQNIKSMGETHQKELQAQKEELTSQVQELVLAHQEKRQEPQNNPQELNQVQNPQLWHNPNTYAMNNIMNGGTVLSDASPRIHTVSFRPKRRSLKTHHNFYLNPAHYVPSNTSVRAVILGGADADASVNGQSKNNGVMLFKFLEDGTLPNGQRSRLRGCRVSANSYGDISSERAYGTLYRLSCAHPGEPIIDKEVTGWVFFNGKVGIKGKPLMRDNKVMTWAGVSGALSGIASAAQYAQSVQAIGPYGATSVVPSSQIAPYAAYGGASKAADTLSQYYVKRAEQYHPVIQVGSGNVVTIVFKDGFYLEPDEDKRQHAMNQVKAQQETHELIASQEDNQNPEMNFTVPPEVLGKIDKANTLSRNETGGLR